MASFVKASHPVRCGLKETGIRRGEVRCNTRLVVSALLAAGRTHSLSFRTGVVSPVNDDWFTRNSVCSTTRPSAEIRSPSSSSITSPATSAVASTSTSRPSRKTRACTGSSRRSASIAFSALNSCQKLKIPLTTFTSAIATLNSGRPASSATPAPTHNSNAMTWMKWPTKRTQRPATNLAEFIRARHLEPHRRLDLGEPACRRTHRRIHRRRHQRLEAGAPTGLERGVAGWPYGCRLRAPIRAHIASQSTFSIRHGRGTSAVESPQATLPWRRSANV